MLWLKVHSHQLLRACLLGSKRKLPPPACQVWLRLPSVVCHPSGMQFPGTVYPCNQGPLSSTWAHRISCASSTCSRCRRCCCYPLQCDRRHMETRLNSARGPGPYHRSWSSSFLHLLSVLSPPLLFSKSRASWHIPRAIQQDNKVIGIEVLPRDPRVELSWQGFKHNDKEQRAEYQALVNTGLHFKLFTVPLPNTDTAPRIGIHPLHQSHNPLLHTKFSQRPPDDLLRHLIKPLLQVYEGHVESCWQLDTSLAAAWQQRLCLLCLCLGRSQTGNRRLTPTVWWAIHNPLQDFHDLLEIAVFSPFQSIPLTLIETDNENLPPSQRVPCHCKWLQLQSHRSWRGMCHRLLISSPLYLMGPVLCLPSSERLAFLTISMVIGMGGPSTGGSSDRYKKKNNNKTTSELFGAIRCIFLSTKTV